MLVNGTELPATVTGHGSYGKCQMKSLAPLYPQAYKLNYHPAFGPVFYGPNKRPVRARLGPCPEIMTRHTPGNSALTCGVRS